MKISLALPGYDKLIELERRHLDTSDIEFVIRVVAGEKIPQDVIDDWLRNLRRKLEAQRRALLKKVEDIQNELD